ncbi:hypothetical protein [Paeniglutamicibacter antarcticus]|uniref:Tetratricopeptide repeat protein n=1 Tax=Paeniglutamicibacter antarcticus TaxID=494023 RepID=A0ABP9TKW5_9MICC
MIAVPDSAKTHTQELLQVPAAGLDSSPRQNIESGVPGILLNLMTMRHEVSDAALAEKTLQSGSASSQVIVLLAKGDLRAASELVAETRLNDPQNFVMRVLDTSLTRAGGDFARATKRLRALLTEFKGTEHESILQQHLGFAYVESGDLLAGANRFGKALDLRTAEGADTHLIESSRACLEAVTARIPAQHTGEHAGQIPGADAAR